VASDDSGLCSVSLLGFDATVIAAASGLAVVALLAPGIAGPPAAGNPPPAPALL
jgi:hypothetical protein